MKNQNDILNASTRELILKSARRQFLEKGFQGAAIRKIAADAGITYGALYGYFSSKEELFYSLTDPLVDCIMEKLNKMEQDMEALPAEKRLFEMNGIFEKHIPELVDLIFEDYEVIKLVIDGAKGTKYENFLSELVKRDAYAVSEAAGSIGESNFQLFDQETLNVLLEGYMAALFHLIISGRDKHEVSQSLKLIGKIYEAGMLAMAKGISGNRQGG